MLNLPLYQRMFRAIFIHSGVRAFFSVATALLMLFIVRLMGPHDFGKFSLVLQLAVTFGLLLSWGSSATLAKFLPELKEKKSQARLSSQAVEVSLLSIALSSLLFLGLSHFYPSLLPLELRSNKFIFILYFSLFAAFNVLQGIFRGLGHFVQWSIVEGSNDFGARVFALLLLLTFSLNYVVVLYCFVSTLFLLTLYSFYVKREQLCIASLKIERQVWQFSILMLVGMILFMAGTSADAVLLRALLKEPREVGYYFAGIRVPQIFQTLLLGPLSIPFTYYFNHPDTSYTREKIVLLGSKLLGVICGTFSLAFFSFGGTIVALFYGERFVSTIPVLRIYSFSLFLLGLTALFGPFYIAINKVHTQVWLGFFSVLLLIGLDYYLIPRWKSSGSALANVIMLTIQAAINIFILSRNQVRLMLPGAILLLGMLLGVVLEIYWIPYSSMPFFLLFVVAVRLFSKEEIEKIQLVISPKSAEATP